MISKMIKLFLGLILSFQSMAWSSDGLTQEKDQESLQVSIACENPHPMIQRLCKQEEEMAKLEDAINLLQVSEYALIFVTIGSLPFILLQKIAKKSAGTLVKNVNEVLSSSQVTESEKKAIQNLMAKNFENAKKQNNVNNIVLGGTGVSFLVMGHYINAFKEEFHRQKGLREIEIRNLKLEILKSWEDGSLEEKFGMPKDKKSGKEAEAPSKNQPKTQQKNDDYI